MNNIVLIVDDDQVSVRLFGIFLERNGYQVVTARNGLEGIHLAADLHPQVIIVDDMMPGMTGGEMCRALKDDLELRDIPVILMSAGTRISDAGYTEAIGADFALAKPCLPRDLLRTLQSVLATRTKT